MSKHVKHVPKHRAVPPRHLLVQAPRKALRNTVVLSSVAVAATGATISGGLIASPVTTIAAAGVKPFDSYAGETAATDLRVETLADSGTDSATLAAAPAPPAADELADRAPLVSRSSDRRETADPVKEAALSVDLVKAVTGTQDLSDGDPREIARALLAEFGFSSDQFGCLDSLYTRESNWNVSANNPYSSAYGIPQALPGSKMSSAGSDWATNPVTQIRWGLGYIEDRYGSPCGAWGHSQSHGWY